MNADMVEVVMKLAALNAAAAVVMVPLSFIGSALALNGLETLDLWMRRKDEKRPLGRTDENA